MNLISKKILHPCFLALISGILLLLSFPPFDLGFLAWIALVPFLLGLAQVEFQKKKVWKLSYYPSQLTGIVFGIVFYYAGLSWIFSIFGALATPLISIMVLYVFVFAFALNFLWSRWKNALTVTIFPAILWVSLEYVKSEGWWGRFSWLNLGYTQHNWLPVLQFASILGQYGISFLIVMVNSAIVSLMLSRRNCKRNMLVPGAVVTALALISMYGFHSLRAKYEPTIKVGLVQDESSELSVYEQMTHALPEDVDFVLWPEYAVPEFLEEKDDLLDRLLILAMEKNCHLIVGAKERAPVVSSKIKEQLMRRQGYPDEVISDLLYFYNTAYLISPDGEIAGKYHKNNPIQFFNDGAAGGEFPSFETAAGKIGICICYDADYSYVARKIVQSGAEMLFVPTYDAMEWGETQHEQHSAMTSMRAVENRRFIARATSSGISQVIDPAGRITATIENGRSGVSTGFVQPIREKTFYTRCGYLLPYFCIAVSIAFGVAAIIKKPASH
jgi:apolipoprotein N-acyltransferase